MKYRTYFRIVITLALIVLWSALGYSCSGGSDEQSGGAQDAFALSDQKAPPTGVDTAGPAVVTCSPNDSCDDGDPCTHSDICSADGVCSGTTYSCDDGDPCTKDICKGEGSCEHSEAPNYCRIGDQCYLEGTTSPDNPCLDCITAVSRTDWTPNNANSCDDGDICTVDDGCEAGQCTGSAKNCDDNNECTDDLCDPSSGCVHEFIAKSCNDNNRCTLGDMCSEGVCQPGVEKLNCNDGNPCTQDSCDATTGCIFANKAGLCDDGDFCTDGDLCQDGVCIPGEDAVVCNDKNGCTDDSCDSLQGCVFTPNKDSCDDGNLCSLGDYCSDGLCLAGTDVFDCSDGNPCTADHCSPDSGCTYTNTEGTCSDDNECTVGDWCQQGACVPGASYLNCSDDNFCTTDICDPTLGCLFTFNDFKCYDNNSCTTNEYCFQGECIGEALSCEDNNECTIDTCADAGGCIHKSKNNNACRPQIFVDYPPRGATLNGQQVVTVTGTVESPAGKLNSFTINDDPVLVNNDGSFIYPMTALQGMNVITALAVDEYGGKDKGVQSYYFSYEWIPISFKDYMTSMIDEGIRVWLGELVFDDGDPGTIKDFASIFAVILQDMDLNSMIPGDISQDAGICTAKIKISKIQYDDPKVHIDPLPNALFLVVTIENFKAYLDIQCGILSATGWVYADPILIESTVNIWVGQAGDIKAQPTGTKVTMYNFDVDLDGVIGFLGNWIIDFFEGDIADQLSGEFEKQINELVPAMLTDALGALAINTTFEIDPFFGSGPPVTLHLFSGLNYIEVVDIGGTLGLWSTVVTPKKISHSPLGSIGRASCLTQQPEWLTWTEQLTHQFQLALQDDLFNQILFGIYWGGLLEGALSGDEIGQDLSGYGISDLTIDFDFLLPPIITSCNPEELLVAQIGDLSLAAVFTLLGMEVDMLMYASLEVEANLGVMQGDEGPELGLSLGEIRYVDIEIAELSDGMGSSQDLLEGLIKENLMPMLLEKLGGSSIGGFPIPAIDLAGVSDAIPQGTMLELDLKKVERRSGYTVLIGNVK